jgi:Ca2+ transporting ATPase
MTGESDHLSKDTIEKCNLKRQEFEQDSKGASRTAHDVASPVLLSGTQIQTGEGKFMCIVVGDETCEGQINALLEGKGPEQTPLQEKLDVIAIDIGKLGMFAAILIFHCLLLRNFIEGMIYRKFDLFGGEFTRKGVPCTIDEEDCIGMLPFYISEWLHYCIVGVAIIVVAVPEGLPLAVMISLAYSVQKMLKDQNFVKRLASCEIMGGANNICSDKTGTLTKNQMTWTQIWAGCDTKIDKPDAIFDKGRLVSQSDLFDTSVFVKNPKTMSLLSEAVSCNTMGTVVDAGATELAMLKFISRCDVDFQLQRKKYLNEDEMIRFPFDSARKRMSTVIDLLEDEPTEFGYPKRLHVKGASEIVLETCTHYLAEDGTKTQLDDNMMQQLD